MNSRKDEESRTMATSNGDGPVRPDWPLVYTVIDRNDNHELAIVTDGSAPDRYVYCSFNPLQPGISTKDERSLSPVRTVQEHGWFRDVDIFTHVCKTESIPTHTITGAPMPQANLFNAWRSGVLLTLATNHRSLWIINDGNTV